MNRLYKALLSIHAESLVDIVSDALSLFELEMIGEVAERYGRFGAAAEVTDREAEVLAQAVAGMETHLRRLFAAGAFRHERARTGEAAPCWVTADVADLRGEVAAVDFVLLKTDRPEILFSPEEAEALGRNLYAAARLARDAAGRRGPDPAFPSLHAAGRA